MFIVWAPMLAPDNRSAAVKASARFTGDHRVTQFWDPDRRVGSGFRDDVFPNACQKMWDSMPKNHFFRRAIGSARDRYASQPQWDIYMFFGKNQVWGRFPHPVRWIRQAARFGTGDGSGLVSLMWIDDFSDPPVEGSLLEHLRATAGDVIHASDR